MEVLIELIGFLIGELMLAGIGWLCLWIWYRDRKMMEQVRDKKYAGEYKAAGYVMILNFIAAVGALFLSVMLVAFIVACVYRSIA